ncbi:c-type cytochrome biogenesis protein CcsB [Cumulibacter manganitolerans]|uniref:c-type cytochrome biogenesis protein CcsB n=1 Tax=Cumulibacter manganitolerans TaxID=1884992 RepID=UPI001297506B|nr:c-type cytochrome biogenesis protein CcsB [Cumulibacter manganitolerans]
MSVNESLAAVSDHLFSGSIIAYSLGLFALCGDYAFGKSERRERAKLAARERTPERELATVGGGDASGAAPIDALPPVEHAEPVTPSVWGPRLGLVGVVLAALGFALQVAALAGRGIATGRLPWGNMFEFASAICIVAVGTYLVMAVPKRSRRFLGVFVLPPVIFILVLIGLRFYAKAGPVVAPLRSYWLGIHVTAATIASGILLVSAVCSALYLVKRRHEAREAAEGGYVASRIAGNLPSSASLDRLAARTMTFAFPIWTFAIITGAIWAESAWGRYWGWDPKETWAFISWVVYAVYLHARATAGWKGNRAAYINLLGAGTMAFNFIVVNTVVSGLHSYSGL